MAMLLPRYLHAKSSKKSPTKKDAQTIAPVVQNADGKGQAYKADEDQSESQIATLGIQPIKQTQMAIVEYNFVRGARLVGAGIRNTRRNSEHALSHL
jgi:hypothetical protein